MSADGEEVGLQVMQGLLASNSPFTQGKWGISGEKGI